MALCESQLDSALPAINREESPSSEKSQEQTPEKKPTLHNGDIYQVPGGLPLAVDYRSPVSHFVPPAVELYAARQKHEQYAAAESSVTPPPVKRKRGRPRIDKTSPEYLANLAARKQAREMAAVMNANRTPDSGEKRKRGRPRVDKTSPEYLARKKARELEALERKAKREYKRRATGAKPIKVLPSRTLKTLPAVNKNKVVRKMPQKNGNTVRKVGDRKVLVRRTGKLIRRKDSAASSSAGENTPRVKRKYTKRAPGNRKDATPNAERVKGKRGRPRKVDQLAALNKQMHQPKIRVRSNLMPVNSEPITLDSDDEPDLGSPSQMSDSLSLDENLRALRHIHEKYANIDKDDRYEAHLLAANFKKPSDSQRRDDDDVLSVRSSEGAASGRDVETRVEKLEDSSNSDSDSSSSGSGSSSSGSSSTSSSGSSSSSDSSDSEAEAGDEKTATAPAEPPLLANTSAEDDSRSFSAWSTGPPSGSESDSDPERAASPPPPTGSHDEISESENESADKSFQCHICFKWYSTRVTLKIHRRVHQNRGGSTRRSRARSGDRYECDCCPETFNRREKLWEHKASAHRGAVTVRCEVCRRCFEDDAELAAHDAAHTDDERAGRCEWCGARFPRWDQLRRHRASAHGAPPLPHSHSQPQSPHSLPHACAVCGKRFSHAHSLTRHMHNHAKQLYRCVVCKASFARADQLAQHLNSHLANYKRLKP